MIREEVRAAVDKIFPCTNEGRCYEQAIGVSGFELGVKWADEHPDLSSLWHSADEEPKDGTHILMEYKFLNTKEFKSYNKNCDGLVNWDILKNTMEYQGGHTYPTFYRKEVNYDNQRV